MTGSLAALRRNLTGYICAEPLHSREAGTKEAAQVTAADGGALVIRAGELTLDAGRLEADAGHGPVPLTRPEFLLLKELASRAGEPVSKNVLLAAVWGYAPGPVSNVVDVCVQRLRSKLGFEVIATVRGTGYQLNDLLNVARLVARVVSRCLRGLGLCVP